jgi:hypothetical protein
MLDKPDYKRKRTVELQGKTYARIPFGMVDRDKAFDVCPDCEAHRGRIHEFGCDWERCPRCDGQFAFCSCHGPAVPIDEPRDQPQERHDPNQMTFDF